MPSRRSWSNDDTRRGYLSRAGYLDRLLKSLLPDTAANEFGSICKVFRVIADKIRSEIPSVDTSEVMAEVEALLDQSICAEALREKFEGSRKPVEVQKLRAKLAFKLARMVQVNRTRIDFLEEFQRMIDEYNGGAINVQVFFLKLLCRQGLDAEDKRGIAEQLTEEELVVFDLLTKPQIALTSKEKADVKRVAKSFLTKLKNEKLVLDWRKQQTARAMVRVTIEDALDDLPRTFTKGLPQNNIYHMGRICAMLGV